MDWSNTSFYGLTPLRERVVETQGYCLPVDNVLITAGTNEANFLVLTQLLSAGDEVIIDKPGWPQAWFLSEAYGADVKIIKRREELGWNIDLDELDALVTPKTKLIFLNSPNNPTGAVFTEDEMKRVCEIARKNDAYLLSDEVYRGLEWDGPLSPAACNYYEKAISTASVSKCFGLRGIRTGWMATHDKDILFKALVLREDASEVMNVLGEHVALSALKPGTFKRMLGEAKAEGQRCWPIVEKWVNSSEDFQWVKPKAGYSALCAIPWT